MLTSDRRTFLRGLAATAAGFTGLGRAAAAGLLDDPGPDTYGNLIADPRGIVDLPPGFQYRIISRWGEEMTDGLLVPGFEPSAGAPRNVQSQSCATAATRMTYGSAAHRRAPRLARRGASRPSRHARATAACVGVTTCSRSVSEHLIATKPPRTVWWWNARAPYPRRRRPGPRHAPEAAARFQAAGAVL